LNTQAGVASTKHQKGKTHGKHNGGFDVSIPVLFHILDDNRLEPPIARETHHDIENKFLQIGECQHCDEDHSYDNKHENDALNLKEELVVLRQECLGTEIIGRDAQNSQARRKKHLFSVHIVMLQLFHRNAQTVHFPVGHVETVP
jgi:hypothetical protein